MIVFVDFEASSLGRRSFPIEVGWASEDGHEEDHLIRPAPDWDDWMLEAEQIHGISLDLLQRDGVPHDLVARRMVEALSGNDLYASAPSWDGQWLSRLLRAAGLPRHALRLRGTEEAHEAAIQAILADAAVPTGVRRDIMGDLISAARRSAAADAPAHRALDDARRELRLWRDIRARAVEVATRWRKR